MSANDTATSSRTEAFIGMLKDMILIRTFDSSLGALYTKGLIRGSAHPAIGQEAVAVGACRALRKDDYITSTHRGHGHAIAKGADIRRMMAELFGRANGYCRGKGGSMHIADFSIGMLGANGIVGGGFGIAAGAALATRIRHGEQVALCFFGEGAINQGAFHEIANLASLWSLPLILLCENNQYAMSSRVTQTTAVGELSRRADAYAMPGVTVDGMDVVGVRSAVDEAVVRARAGSGPSLIVGECYRFHGHFAGDLMPYRDTGEAEPWLARDPIKVEFDRLAGAGLISADEFAALVRDAEERIAEAIEFATSSPFPAEDETWTDI